MRIRRYLRGPWSKPPVARERKWNCPSGGQTIGGSLWRRKKSLTGKHAETFRTTIPSQRMTTRRHLTLDMHQRPLTPTQSYSLNNRVSVCRRKVELGKLGKIPTFRGLHPTLLQNLPRTLPKNATKIAEIMHKINCFVLTQLLPLLIVVLVIHPTHK